MIIVIIIIIIIIIITIINMTAPMGSVNKAN